jgi:thiamine pyrophosphate-dependent acetolactate synthase large subunit-like protein
MPPVHSAAELLESFLGLGATHLVGIPDNGSAALFESARTHPRIDLVTVTREGEAFALASGLWIGGGAPVVAIQNTGLLESGDALRGTAVRMGIPLLCLIGYRGHASMDRSGIDPFHRPDSTATLRRPDVDSTALLTEPTLEAWGIPHAVMEPGLEKEMVVAAWNRALDEDRPIALLLAHATA